MFGGIAFLVDGNLAVAVSHEGGILVRIEPSESGRLQRSTTALPMEMRGRAMKGWLRVACENLRTKRQLEPWVRRGTAYARSLPKK